MFARTAKQLHDMIVVQMGNPDGVYLTVAPSPAYGWDISVSATGAPSRAVKYNQIAQEIAAELRQKNTLTA